MHPHRSARRRWRFSTLCCRGAALLLAVSGLALLLAACGGRNTGPASGDPAGGIQRLAGPEEVYEEVRLAVRIPAEVVERAGGPQALRAYYVAAGPKTEVQEGESALEPDKDAYAVRVALRSVAAGELALHVALLDEKGGPEAPFAHCTMNTVVSSPEHPALSCAPVLAPRAGGDEGLATVTFRVVDEGGAPVAGAAVSVDGRAAGITGRGLIDKSGAFTAYLRPGEYEAIAGLRDRSAKVAIKVGPEGATVRIGCCPRAAVAWYHDFAGGSGHTVAAFTAWSGTRTLWAWGSNAQGRLGTPTTEICFTGALCSSKPVQVGSDTGWRRVFAGWNHSLALDWERNLWAWGNNAYHELGDGTATLRSAPVPVCALRSNPEGPCELAFSGVEQVDAGVWHNLALKTDGTLWAWGSDLNHRGMLGDGGFGPQPTPVQIGLDADWMAVSVGREHSLALKQDGSLWGWGDNGLHGLGDGTRNNYAKPTPIGKDQDWVAIAAGSYHSLGLKSDGTLWSWGYNAYGGLGTPNSSPCSISQTIGCNPVPVRVGQDGDWVAIAVQQEHSLALKADGTLWAWGQNRFGESGKRTGDVCPGQSKYECTLKPTQVGTDSDWDAIAAGGSQSLARKFVRTGGGPWPGGLFAWGGNYVGQLGTPSGEFCSLGYPRSTSPLLVSPW